MISDKLQKEKIEELDEKFYKVDSVLIQTRNQMALTNI